MQSARDVYEALLTEINKVNAPPLLLEDFNYFFNKAINLYINKKYNIYEVNLQSTDDLRVLKSTAILDVYTPWSDESDSNAIMNRQIYGAYYEAVLPSDYLHLLNCICLYNVKKQYKCYKAGSIVKFAAQKLTADQLPQIINNSYRRPTYKNPYYYIINVNKDYLIPTNKQLDFPSGIKNGEFYSGIKIGTDVDAKDNSELYNQASSVDFSKVTGLSQGQDKLVITNLSSQIPGQNNINYDLYNPLGGVRYGNKTSVIMLIRYGEDNSLFELNKIAVDYIKSPQFIRLTQEQLDKTEDTSQILEWPDNVVQLIISELTMIVLENAANPRLQTNIPVNLTIANPLAQALS